MLALSLFCVLVLAKSLAVLQGELSLEPWAPAAWFWQDALVALGFAGLERWVRRPAITWTAYGLILAYTALNVGVVRVLGTPLTHSMLRATDGTISDSILHHLTWSNLSPVGLVVLAGLLVPLAACRVGRGFGTGVGKGVGPRARWVLAALGLALVITGQRATALVTTRGLHRTAVILLSTSAFPRLGAAPSAERADWREPTQPAAHDGLPHLRARAAGRNVVLVVLESAGARYLRPYGAAEDPMPNLSLLSERALLFERTYAVYPESIKGLMALQSSLHPALDTAVERYANSPVPSLGELLASEGYATALFHSGRFDYLGMRSILERGGYALEEDAADIGGEYESSFGVDELITVQRILEWIDGQRSEQPFFVSYLPIAGHHPYDSPEQGPFTARTEQGAYLNALHYADRALGELIAGLKARALWQDTLLVVVGDHGQAFGQHPGNYGHTFFIYEENVHIPLVLALPGLVSESVRIAELSSQVDIAPTVLDLLGLPAPELFEGRSLLQPTASMALMFTDYSLAIVGLRDGPWKYLYDIESGSSELFDLRTDPGELRNLAALHDSRVQLYRERLLGWCRAQRATVMAWDERSSS